MRLSKTAIVLALCAAVVFAACGGDGDDDTGGDASSSEVSDDLSPSDTDEGDDAVTEDAEEEDDPVAGDVPDACGVVDNETLTEILGADPGAGTPQSVIPSERTVCMYESGLILAVEIAEHYEISVDMIREAGDGSTVEDVTGVGSAAIWQDYGGPGQLVALGDDYFVGVTLASEGKDAGVAIATEMLANL